VLKNLFRKVFWIREKFLSRRKKVSSILIAVAKKWENVPLKFPLLFLEVNEMK
jgi:hypothetical protein